MATKFADFILALENEARAEGPEAVAQLELLRSHFRVRRDHLQARADRAVPTKPRSRT